MTELGLTYMAVNVAADREQRPEVVAVSGQSGVPVLQDGDKVYTDPDDCPRVPVGRRTRGRTTPTQHAAMGAWRRSKALSVPPRTALARLAELLAGQGVHDRLAAAGPQLDARLPEEYVLLHVGAPAAIAKSFELDPKAPVALLVPIAVIPAEGGGSMVASADPVGQVWLYGDPALRRIQARRQAAPLRGAQGAVRPAPPGASGRPHSQRKNLRLTSVAASPDRRHDPQLHPVRSRCPTHGSTRVSTDVVQRQRLAHRHHPVGQPVERRRRPRHEQQHEPEQQADGLGGPGGGRQRGEQHADARRSRTPRPRRPEPPRRATPARARRSAAMPMTVMMRAPTRATPRLTSSCEPRSAASDTPLARKRRSTPFSRYDARCTGSDTVPIEAMTRAM